MIVNHLNFPTIKDGSVPFGPGQIIVEEIGGGLWLAGEQRAR